MPGPLVVPAGRGRARAARARACRVAWPGAGVDDDAGRLVDDEQVLVLPRDAQRRIGSGSSARLAARAASNSSSSPPSSRWLFGRRSPSTSTAPARAAARRRARADLGQLGEEAVEPLARGRSGTRERTTLPSGRRCARSAAASAPKQDRDADDDEGVGEVERRPEAQVEEVGHVPEPDAVERGSRRCRRAARPSATGSSGMARARAGEEDEHPGDRERRQRRSRSTSRSRRGRRRCPSSGRGGSRTARRRAPPRRARAGSATICFVSWSAATAASGDRAEADPLRGPRRQRPLGDRDRRAARSCAEPTRTSIASCGGRARSSPLLLPLVVDAERRPRHRLEPLVGRSACRRRCRCRTCPRRCAAARRRSRRARPSLSSSVLVELAVVGRGRGVGEVVVRSGLLVVSSSSGPGFVLLEVLERVLDALALLEQRSRNVRCRVSCSLGALKPALCSRARSRPSSSTTLSRTARPETSETARRGTRSAPREQVDDGLVRAATLRRGGDAHLPGIAVAADSSVRRAPGETRSRSTCRRLAIRQV